MNISERLKQLRPYVVGLRFSETIPLIDCVFNDYWKLDHSDKINFVKNENSNSYICYSESADITIDDLLDFIDETIKYNKDEEEKVELFRLKLDELKVIFETNDLSKVKRLSFNFLGDSEPIPNKPILSNPPPPVNIPVSKEQNVNEYRERDMMEPTKRLIPKDEINTDNREPKAPPTPVCRCRGNEQCSVCLGIDM